ncbi:hypothetical protein TI39_contig5842g00022 [Zymoseptoria brevis]|uniref:feruloyl esterase n=1 Tax=Zymoseptoria brevis TaxID=1047168 RepID=A0A0F4G8H0_9PEZI|nr:hypothetical protein TI39_contig5842g00022 [Zymoseptoria brevis]
MLRAILLSGCIISLAAASTLPQRCASGTCAAHKNHNTGYNGNPDTHHIINTGYAPNEQRNYSIWIPEDYNDQPSKLWPLIIDFHGHGGSPILQHNNSLYYKNSRGKEYIVACRPGRSDWQDRRRESVVWTQHYAYTGKEEDFSFVTKLVSHLKDEYCIDPDRVYASGKSNGGGFVDTLACDDTGDQFAAFAMAAAALYTDNEQGNCPKKRAILEAHGDKDGIISYPGKDTNQGKTPRIGEWTTWWKERTCSASTQRDNISSPPDNYDIRSYSCDSRSGVVQQYHGTELGHCWPIMKGSNTDSGKKNCTDRSLDFTEKVIDFFEKWDLTTTPSNE